MAVIKAIFNNLDLLNVGQIIQLLTVLFGLVAVPCFFRNKALKAAYWALQYRFAFHHSGNYSKRMNRKGGGVTVRD